MSRPNFSLKIFTKVTAFNKDDKPLMLHSTLSTWQALDTCWLLLHIIDYYWRM